ncbi:MAG: molybdenum cofactor biosynthesis protein B [Candidatus Magnetoglobus multicellularis str. Araruama]|uniref:Molybdenum cofactor biosynthesis protein B n=1 Tax=Candidatus Magnetoglobus multicellularis str. Araruama TaxID=890399 RepID=A0A1V1P9D9_9BACT|nr:MAG: molybdenum cofactor biosynthesis protein B [Candidatus Magnetoglobus multicellularis str. Araruama]
MKRPKHHHGNAPQQIGIAILTVSTSRTMDTDKSGHWIIQRARKEGYRLETHIIIPDNLELIRKTVLDLCNQSQVNVILMTGGTGLSPNDLTIEAVTPLFTKSIPAFAAIFSYLSFEQIDSAAILSRATAGCIEDTVVFCMPGSIDAVKLACKELIFGELNHICHHVFEKKEQVVKGISGDE